MIYGTVIGNLGGAAETKTISTGKLVTNFSIAAKNGRDKDATVWVRCALWGARGEKVAQYLEKGTRVTVMGVITTREHNGKTYVECDVQELALQGGGPKDSSRTVRNDTADDEPPPF